VDLTVEFLESSRRGRMKRTFSLWMIYGLEAVPGCNTANQNTTSGRFTGTHRRIRNLYAIGVLLHANHA